MGERTDGDGDFLAALRSRICCNLLVKVADDDWAPVVGNFLPPLKGTTDISGWCCVGADLG